MDGTVSFGVLVSELLALALSSVNLCPARKVQVAFIINCFVDQVGEVISSGLMGGKCKDRSITKHSCLFVRVCIGGTAPNRQGPFSKAACFIGALGLGWMGDGEPHPVVCLTEPSCQVAELVLIEV